MSFSYFQDFNISEIVPCLWVSNRLIPERDYDIVKEKGIGAVVSLVEEQSKPLPDTETLHFPIADAEFIPAHTLDLIFSFVKRAMQYTNVLIYCSAGVSRSAGIAIGILMAQENCSWERAHDLFDLNRFSWVSNEVRESVQSYFCDRCQSPDERRQLCSEDAKALDLLEKEIYGTLPPAKDTGWSSFGYKIRDDRIVGLGLRHTGLREIPDGCILTRLEYINLSGNLIENIPEPFFEMPELRELHLNNNRISRLPETIAWMKNLKELDCRNNFLASIPCSIGEIRESLTFLSFGANQLSDLPDSIGTLRNLRALNLNGNRFRALPETIGHLDGLFSLSLGKNLLSRLPNTITRLTDLKRLNIGLNKQLLLTDEQERWQRELKENGCLIIRDL